VKSNGPPKDAVTLPWEVSVSTHEAEPLQSPDQPKKAQLAAGAWVSVTAVPVRKFALQVPLEQLMPAGDEVTVPCPERVTLSVCVVANAAPTEVSVLKVSEQGELLPVHPPDHPVNAAPPFAVAVRLT
jgi:hypothetical protein